MSNLLYGFYDKIRSNVNVSDVVRNYVTLSKKGGEYTGLCPFHSEKTPSFTVNDQKKFFHCFGCGAHGDVIKFESEQTGMSFKDAAYKIADKFQIPVPKFSKEEEKEQLLQDRVMTLLSDASKYFVSCMNNTSAQTLIDRGIKKDTITRYHIGYSGKYGGLIEYFAGKNVRLEELANCGLVTKRSDGKYYEFFNNRIIIPILSSFGKVIAFGGRANGDDMPKYLNSAENPVFKKGESLFGEDIAYSFAHKSGFVILVEGYFDVIGLHQSGFQNVVASLGTAVTEAQLAKLWKLAPEIVVCLDGDEAGKRASKKVLDLAINMIGSNKKLSFVSLPKGLDPDDLIGKYGKETFQRYLSSRSSLSEFIFNIMTSGKPYSTAEDRAIIEQNLANYTNQITDFGLRKNMQQFYKDRCWKLYNNKEKKNENLIKPETEISSELDKIDDIILGFIAQNLNVISEERVSNILEIISSSITKGKYANIILEFISSQENLKDADFYDFIKKTSFKDEFDILCATSKGSISEFSNEIKLDDILEYLLLKRYLINLIDEFQGITKASNNPTNDESNNISDENIEEKLKFYINEIKSVRDQIQKLNTQFALNDR